MSSAVFVASILSIATCQDTALIPLPTSKLVADSALCRIAFVNR